MRYTVKTNIKYNWLQGNGIMFDVKCFEVDENENQRLYHGTPVYLLEATIVAEYKEYDCEVDDMMEFMNDFLVAVDRDTLEAFPGDEFGSLCWHMEKEEGWKVDNYYSNLWRD